MKTNTIDNKNLFHQYFKAADASDAVAWCISDGEQFITIVDSRNIITNSASERWIYKKLANAENTLKNLNSGKKTKEIYSDFHVFSCPKEAEIQLGEENITAAEKDKTLISMPVCETEKPIEQTGVETTYAAPAALTEIDKSEIIEKNQIEKLKSSLMNIYALFNSIPTYYAALEKELHVREHELLDLRHYIELQNFNASEGYKLSKLMQKILQERRIIKDKQKILRAFSDKPNKENNVTFEHLYDINLVSQISAALKVIDSLDTRKYRPRELENVKEIIHTI